MIEYTRPVVTPSASASSAAVSPGGPLDDRQRFTLDAAEGARIEPEWFGGHGAILSRGG
jgi:hypothetical protein